MQFDVNNRTVYAYTGAHQHAPGAPAVVFLHGAQNDHSVWILQSRYLANHGYSVLALDLPGHGRSAGEAIRTIDELADWTILAIEAAGFERAAIVGHSMGSLIALAAAAKSPQRVDRIAMIGSAFPMAVSDALLNAAADDEPSAIDMIANWSHSAINRPPASPGPGFSIFMQSKRLMQRQQNGVLLCDFNACNEYVGGDQAARELQCPLLMVSGNQDMMTPPRAAKRVFEAATEAAASENREPPRQVILADTGHSIMAEQPDALLKELTQFLAP